MDVGGGFDFTDADLTDAVFDRAQCINCKFTGATLTHANFTGAYLPGATFAGATSLRGPGCSTPGLLRRSVQQFVRAGRRDHGRWAWPLALGSSEAYGPVPFADTDFGDLPAGKLDNVGDCPDGKGGQSQPAGCAGHLLPDPAQAPPLPAPCSSAATDACPTRTSTVLGTAKLGTPLAVVSANPVTWATTLGHGGEMYAGFDDGTLRQVEGDRTMLVAGDPKQRCPASTDSCGDGGPAKDALLGRPAGLAVGLDGSVYVADSDLHRVRRIDPSGTIVTIAGDGSACAVNKPDCGNGGPATRAKLEGPYGVWVDPVGDVYIADGSRGIREVRRDGTIVYAAGANLNLRSVVGDASGKLFAADPDTIVEFTAGARDSLKRVVGTGTTGYNGNTDRFGTLLPGTKVMVDHPQSLAMGLDGDLIFADSGNDLIRAYVPSSGHVIDLAGSVVDGVPKAGFNDDGRWADRTELDHPQAVTATRGGLFIVADSGNQRLRRFGPGPTDETSGGAR